MGQTTEELNTEIADTRENLAADLDALQDRVSPQAIMDRRKAAARSRLSGLRSRVMGSSDPGPSDGPGATEKVKGAAGDAAGTAQSKVEGSPLTAGAIAFGIGMVIAAALPATETEAQASGRLVDAAHDQGAVDAAKAAGQDLASGLKESAGQAAQQVAETAKDSATTVKDEGQASAERVRS
jgi:ElaB/YqjD/DUF883 family membrane-anchored ribosome-binding protein